MSIAAILWIFVWAGMFTDIYYLQSPKVLSDFFTFFQASRALLPIAALFFCIFLLMAVRKRLVLYKTSLGFFIIYCIIGLLASLFVSPQAVISMYWGGMFLAALLVVWLADSLDEPLAKISQLMWINCYACMFLILLTTPQTINVAKGQAPYTQFYKLPFGLGEIRVNGVGRFALIVAIFTFIQFLHARKIGKFFWGFFAFISLLTLAYTRSRTSLLGLAVVSLLFIFLQGADLRLLIVGPIAAYILWISGYKWRAQQHFERLLNLTGREYTWERGIEQIQRSPIFGWGFHADRLMLDSEHMHNSYLHSMIQSGILGGLLFAAAILSVWILIIKHKLIKRARLLEGEEKNLLMCSILLTGFLTSRSFFESTAAFYGVDLLVLLPAVSYIFAWTQKYPLDGA
jgi:O-antigen ligase